jgi:hypothetical protein
VSLWQTGVGLPIGNLTSQFAVGNPKEASERLAFGVFANDNHPARVIARDEVPKQSHTGLPIGNLTSQFFANVYLNELDYFVKFDLREKYYIRYMDDFLVFGDDKKYLAYLKERISGFLLNTLKLNLHEKKSTIFPAGDGVSFLGFRIFRDYRLILKENVKRFVKRMKRMAFEYRNGLVGLSDITNSVQSWIAYARYGNTYHLRNKILARMVFTQL